MGDGRSGGQKNAPRHWHGCGRQHGAGSARSTSGSRASGHMHMYTQPARPARPRPQDFCEQRATRSHARRAGRDARDLGAHFAANLAPALAPLRPRHATVSPTRRAQRVQRVRAGQVAGAWCVQSQTLGAGAQARGRGQARAGRPCRCTCRGTRTACSRTTPSRRRGRAANHGLAACQRSVYSVHDAIHRSRSLSEKTRFSKGLSGASKGPRRLSDRAILQRGSARKNFRRARTPRRLDSQRVHAPSRPLPAPCL